MLATAGSAVRAKLPGGSWSGRIVLNMTAGKISLYDLSVWKIVPHIMHRISMHEQSKPALADHTSEWLSCGGYQGSPKQTSRNEVSVHPNAWDTVS